MLRRITGPIQRKYTQWMATKAHALTGCRDRLLNCVLLLALHRKPISTTPHLNEWVRDRWRKGPNNRRPPKVPFDQCPTCVCVCVYTGNDMIPFENGVTREWMPNYSRTGGDGGFAPRVCMLEEQIP